ncbi:PEGA domain-containing protein [Methanoplanus sp. FWC-SCC4]|uniref:PEGA domain-containing protein n=1 Tax=Methanochimaera problematica TaxID=2609417 RepID=A0AA97I4T7_9EURY|nr:PEGA domain-containing protein [Methanoplanus sp. FWC-SCC4]WOF16844.1 PEGA domain-containing protein [Methanoplanus sp. FWC-SCC4]
MDLRRFLALLILLGAICCVVQATTLTVTVRDNIDQSPVTGASVYIDGNYIGSTNSLGKLVYSHSFSSNFRLGVEKSGYKYWNDLISPGTGSVVADVIRQKGILQINVMDSDTLEPIGNALVKVSGTDITDSESTDSTGSAEFEVPLSATYNVEVQMPRYETIIKSVEVDTTSKKVDYLLKRNDLVIFQIKDGESTGTTKAPLSGAEIYIDDKLAGETGSEGKVTLYIEHERSYDIRIEKSQYQTFEENHFFASDDIIYSATLSKSLYPVTVSVYNSEKVPVENAEIYIDDQLFGSSDTYGRSPVTKLSSGIHSFEVRKTGYDTWKLEKNIDGSDENIIATLAFSTAKATIIVQDNDQKLVPNAAVLVNGKNIGVTDAQGKLKTDLITNSQYSFEVSAKEYESFNEIRDVPLGSQEITINLVLKKSFNVLFVGGVIAAIVLIGGGVYLAMNYTRGNKRGGKKGKRPPIRYNNDGL